MIPSSVSINGNVISIPSSFPMTHRRDIPWGTNIDRPPSRGRRSTPAQLGNQSDNKNCYSTQGKQPNHIIHWTRMMHGIGPIRLAARGIIEDFNHINP